MPASSPTRRSRLPSPGSAVAGQYATAPMGTGPSRGLHCSLLRLRELIKPLRGRERHGDTIRETSRLNMEWFALCSGNTTKRRGVCIPGSSS